MRKAILAVLAASGLVALGAAPAEAVGTRYPFCLQGNEYPDRATALSQVTSSARRPRRDGFSSASPIPIMSVRANHRPQRIAGCGPRVPPAPGYGRYERPPRAAPRENTHYWIKGCDS